MESEPEENREEPSKKPKSILTRKIQREIKRNTVHNISTVLIINISTVLLTL